VSATSALVSFEHRVSWYERGGVSILAETEMNEIEDRGRSSDLLEFHDILGGRGFQVFSGFNGHGMDLLRPQRNMQQQTFADVSEIAIWMPVRGHSLIDLKEVHTGPWDVFVCERAQHDPRSVTAADGQ
jgi:hypothetical protein